MATVSQVKARGARRRILGTPRSPGADGAKAQTALGFLDSVADTLQNPNAAEEQVTEALEELFTGLRELRGRSSADQWRELIAAARRHRLRELVHQDPFTRRAFEKPRGYAGDAVMMDYIYGREEFWPEPAMTEVGESVYRFTTGSPASAGVRARRGHIAEVLDGLAIERPHAEILSIASGHLREALLSAAVRRTRFGRFVAMDADAESLAEVERSYHRLGVETCRGNIRKLIAGRIDLGQFDLVYTTGLFDYLGATAGRRLTSAMFQMLRPGGRLIVANFLPDVADVGYMEAYMDWHLVYRDRHDMIDLTREIPQNQLSDLRVRAEENENIIFLEVIRR